MYDTGLEDNYENELGHLIKGYRWFIYKSNLNAPFHFFYPSTQVAVGNVGWSGLWVLVIGVESGYKREPF
jgi:hypothetical protein